MDDLITGAITVEQGFELYQMAKRIMKDAGLNLRKWSSNSNSLMMQISEAESIADPNCPSDIKGTLIKERGVILQIKYWSSTFCVQDRALKAPWGSLGESR